MTDKEALKLALEALERSVATCFDRYAHEQVMSRPEHFINQAITAIKEALAQPEMRKATREEKISNPGVYEVPVQPAPRNVTAEEHRVLTNALLKAGKVISPPQRQLESTTDMMMELADRLGELPEDIDPRAWGHLLVYVPKRTWVGLTNKDIIEMWPETSTVGWDDIRLIEAKLKEKNT